MKRPVENCRFLGKNGNISQQLFYHLILVTNGKTAKGLGKRIPHVPVQHFVEPIRQVSRGGLVRQCYLDFGIRGWERDGYMGVGGGGVSSPIC